MGILVWIYLYINYSPSLRSIFDVNIENLFISDGHIDDNF